MARWTQYDEDSYRLPEGMTRISYDDYTGCYTYRDDVGKRYRGLPNEEYGAMVEISSNPGGPVIWDEPEEYEDLDEYESPANSDCYDALPLPTYRTRSWSDGRSDSLPQPPSTGIGCRCRPNAAIASSSRSKSLSSYTSISQYDEDSIRLPPGFKRVAFNSNTHCFTFRDHRGRIYRGAPGEEYGELTLIISTKHVSNLPTFSERSPPLVPAQQPLPPTINATRLVQQSHAVVEDIPVPGQRFPSNDISAVPQRSPSTFNDILQAHLIATAPNFLPRKRRTLKKTPDSRQTSNGSSGSVEGLRLDTEVRKPGRDKPRSSPASPGKTSRRQTPTLPQLNIEAFAACFDEKLLDL